jgi:hypothetical protein
VLQLTGLNYPYWPLHGRLIASALLLHDAIPSLPPSKPTLRINRPGVDPSSPFHRTSKLCKIKIMMKASLFRHTNATPAPTRLLQRNPTTTIRIARLFAVLGLLSPLLVTAGARAPAFVPPDKTPSPPYLQFPG